MAENERALDLLSTSQTKLQRCVYGAPMVAIVSQAGATIGQACCNHWDCPACGVKRARQEYRRIVSGCETLAMGHSLYFWTVTCRGRECSLEEAEEHYYEWTNVLLTNARTKCKRENSYWAYVQITERQQKNRVHPHSHIITTYCPNDALLTKDREQSESLVSAWFSKANFTAKLGDQHRISVVKTASGVSRYVAKYMFKDSLLTRWPAGWKRVRYSTNWPAMPEYTPDFVEVLRSQSNWHAVGRRHENFLCESVETYELARHHVANIHPPIVDK